MLYRRAALRDRKEMTSRRRGHIEFHCWAKESGHLFGRLLLASPPPPLRRRDPFPGFSAQRALLGKACYSADLLAVTTQKLTDLSQQRKLGINRGDKVIDVHAVQFNA